MASCARRGYPRNTPPLGVSLLVVVVHVAVGEDRAGGHLRGVEGAAPEYARGRVHHGRPYAVEVAGRGVHGDCRVAARRGVVVFCYGMHWRGGPGRGVEAVQADETRVQNVFELAPGGRVAAVPVVMVESCPRRRVQLVWAVSWIACAQPAVQRVRVLVWGAMAWLSRSRRRSSHSQSVASASASTSAAAAVAHDDYENAPPPCPCRPQFARAGEPGLGHICITFAVYAFLVNSISTSSLSTRALAAIPLRN